MNIVHIIPKITHGGGMPNIITEVKTSIKLGEKSTNLVVSLEAGVSPELLKVALNSGLKVLITPAKELLQKILLKADIIIIHYWNCPSLYLFYRFLEEQKISGRICVNLKVNGCTIPQIVPTWVYQLADGFITSSPATPSSNISKHTVFNVLPTLVNLPICSTLPPTPSFETFQLFHAGTLNAFKIHPNFIKLHANISKNNYSLNIWGAGADEQFETKLKGNKWIHYHGFSNALQTDILSQHLLCNPQTALSYGSFDKIMLESQWLGKPVIVLKESYISTHIKHNINGIVAENERDYAEQLKHIIENTTEYLSLSKRTFEFAHDTYSLENIVQHTYDMYEQICALPKSERNMNLVPNDVFMAVLDGMGDLKVNLLNNDLSNFSEEEKYFILSCEGGLIHFYNAFPDHQVLKNTIQLLLDGSNQLI